MNQPSRLAPASLLDIPPGYSGYAHNGRFHVELADVENSFGVDVRLAAQAQHFLVAGTLPPSRSIPNNPRSFDRSG